MTDLTADIGSTGRGLATNLFSLYGLKDTGYNVSTSFLNCARANKIAIEITATFTGTPTSFDVIALFRRTGQTQWQEYRIGEWNHITYAKAEIDAIVLPVAKTLVEILAVDAVSEEFTIALVGLGTTGSTYFTVTVNAQPMKV